MPTTEFIERIASCSWKASFLHLAKLAFTIEHVPEGPRSEIVRERTIHALRDLRPRDPGAADMLRRCATVVAKEGDTLLLAHEEAISFLQHVVLVHGGENEVCPSDSDIFLWLAATNGHLSRQEDREETESVERQTMASMLRCARFNNRPDALREITRSYLIFRDPPSHPATQKIWKDLQNAAFPETGFEDFFELELGLSYLLSQLWGDTDCPNPTIDLVGFFSKTILSKERSTALMGTLSKSRSELRDEICKEPLKDNLPLAPCALRHWPFVKVDASTVLAASPGALRSQLRTGLWSRYRSAAKDLSHGAKEANRWPSDFGYVVEYWCRRVATEAKRTLDVQRAPAAQIVLSKSAGSKDEIEDVVVLEGDVGILFSVKSRPMTESIVRGTATTEDVFAWLESFFFEKKKGSHRGGAIRLLDSRIDKLREGEFEKLSVARSIRVCPVIVTYDDFGLNDLHYQWLEERSKDEGLLGQGGVGPLAVVHVEDFEDLMAFIAQGISIAALLDSRADQNRHRRLDQIIHEIGKPQRQPFFVREMDDLANRMSMKLFGHCTR